MKLISKNTQTALAGLIATIASILMVHGDVAIAYGPTDSYVTGDTNFARTAGTTGSGPFVFRRSFNDSAADPLSPTSGFTGPNFYGGYQFISSTIDQGFNRQQIRNNASPDTTDQIYLQSFNSGGWLGSELSLNGIYLFNQEDFANGLNTGSIALDSISLTTTGFVNSADATIDFEGRYAIEIGGSYYLSQTTFNLRQNDGSAAISGATLTNELWAIYNPVSDLNFDQGSATFEGLSLEGITAVGLYFEEDAWAGTDSSSTAYGLGIRSFEATATTIPETSSVTVLLGLTSLLTVVGLRIRRK